MIAQIIIVGLVLLVATVYLYIDFCKHEKTELDEIKDKIKELSRHWEEYIYDNGFIVKVDEKVKDLTFLLLSELLDKNTYNIKFEKNYGLHFKINDLNKNEAESLYSILIEHYDYVFIGHDENKFYLRVRCSYVR